MEKKINCINKIMNIMQNINYGFLNEEGKNIFDDEKVEFIFNKAYYLLSPKELLDKKYGVCWDQVELERKLFDENNIKNETYFIYIDDKNNLPSHSFLVYYLDSKVYWFEHSWFNEKGIHEYNSLNELLNDVEIKFIQSQKNKVEYGLDIHIYRYEKPAFSISCNQFYEYIFTQKEVFNYKLDTASIKDLDRLKYYKLKTIVEYAGDLSDEEINQINSYINNTVPKLITEYNNIIYKGKIIGSILAKKVDSGFLLDEIYIEKEYRNKGIGSTIIRNYIWAVNKNVYLWVYKKNIRAVQLYKNIGFKVINETDSRYYMKYSNE